MFREISAYREITPTFTRPPRGGGKGEGDPEFMYRISIIHNTAFLQDGRLTAMVFPLP